MEEGRIPVGILRIREGGVVGTYCESVNKCLMRMLVVSLF